MQANISVVKQRAKSIEILGYIQNLKSYNLKIVYEHAGNFSSSTFILPEQFLYPYKIISTDYTATQPPPQDDTIQQITIIDTKKQSYLNTEQPSFFEGNKVHQAKEKKEFDFDSFANMYSTSQYLNKLKRDVMTVRVKRGHKKIKP